MEDGKILSESASDFTYENLASMGFSKYRHICWTYGEYNGIDTFVKNLKDLLPGEHEILTVREKPENLKFVPFEHYYEMEGELTLLNDDEKGNICTFIHAPLHTSNPKLFDLLGKLQFTVAVLHDVYAADLNYVGEHVQANYLSWLGPMIGLAHSNLRLNNLRLLTGCDHVISPSKFVKERFKQSGIESVVIPHPFEATLFKYVNPKTPRRKKDILFGSFHKQDPLAYGWAVIEAMKKGFNVHLLVSNELEMKRAERYLNHPQVTIEYVNSQPQVFHLMQSCEYVVDVTSQAESFGFFVREALFFQAKVFARPIGALAEIEDPNFIHFSEETFIEKLS